MINPSTTPEPPRRERREDILLLARVFAADAAGRTGRNVSGFTPAAAHQLLRYNPNEAKAE